MQINTKIVSCHTADSKPVKQEVNGTVILPPSEFPDQVIKEVEGVERFGADAHNKLQGCQLSKYPTALKSCWEFLFSCVSIKKGNIERKEEFNASSVVLIWPEDKVSSKM